MSRSITGTTLTSFYWSHEVAPAVVRVEPVVVGSIISHNESTGLQFLQFYRNAPNVGTSVPLFSVPLTPGGITIIDSTHLGGTGISTDRLHIAVSQSMRDFSPVITTIGTTQLMIR
jgi:hypothetical protein